MKKELTCTYCDYKAPWKNYLQTHKKAIHEGQTYPCTQCGYSAKRKPLLRKHIKSAHNPEEYFEADIKTELKDENHHGDTKSIKQEESKIEYLCQG